MGLWLPDQVYDYSRRRRSSAALSAAAAASTTVLAENAAATGAANAAAPKVTPAAGNASAASAANAAGPKVTVNAECATATGAANPAAPKVTPAAGNAAATGAVRAAFVEDFEWSGYQWTKRTGSGLSPGPNTFGGTSDSIRVDSNGYLVLTVQQVGGVWTCAEVQRLGASLGYGRYRWTYEIDVANLDPKPVFGMFIYDDDVGAAPSQREIDLEVSKWNFDTETSSMFYSVHPVADGEHLASDHHQSTVGTYTAEFVWQEDQVYFRTVDSNGELLGEHVVTEGVQDEGTETVRMNLWLIGGAAPEDGLPITVTIHSFDFTADTAHTLAAASDFFGGFDDPYEWAYKDGADITGGELVLPTTPSYTAAYSGSILDLRNSSTQVEISETPNVGNGSTEAAWYLRYDPDNFIAFIISGGGLLGRLRQGGVNTTQSFGTHNATTHRYWRVSLSGTTVTFETSSDGSSWTSQWTPTTTLTSQQLSTLRMRFDSGHYDTEPDPGQFAITAYGVVVVDAGNAAATGAANNAAVSISTTALAGNAAATGAANQPAITASDTQPAENAAATGAANSAAVAVTPGVTPAQAVGAAVTPKAAVTPVAGNAAATGAANNPSITISDTQPAENAAATGAAYQPTIALTRPAEHAAATGAATAAAPKVTVNAECAAATGAAAGAVTDVKVNAGSAAAAGQALDAAPTTASVTNVSAENAAATGAANAPAPGVAPAPATAAVAGAANAPAPAVVPVAATASGTGSAGDATVATSQGVPAGNAAAAGTANNAAVAITTGTFAADAMAAARMAHSPITVRPAEGAATGAARDATASTAAFTTASAQCASATGVAYNATASGQAQATTASGQAAGGDGAAYDASVLVVSRGGAGGWQSLINVLREVRREAAAPQYERACPHDGEPYRFDHNGHRVCPFDGYRPDGAGEPLRGRDWGGLVAAMTGSPGVEPQPTVDELRAGWGP